MDSGKQTLSATFNRVNTGSYVDFTAMLYQLLLK